MRVNEAGSFSGNQPPIITSSKLEEISCIEVEIGKKWRNIWKINQSTNLLIRQGRTGPSGIRAELRPGELWAPEIFKMYRNLP